MSRRLFYLVLVLGFLMPPPFVNRSTIAQKVTLAAATVPYAASDVPFCLDVPADTTLLPHINSGGTNLILTDSAGNYLPFERGFTRLLTTGTLGWTFETTSGARKAGDLRVVAFYDLANTAWKVAAWNVATRTATVTTLATNGAATKDMHCAPCVEVDSSGFIYVFCSGNQDTTLKMFKSTAAYSIAAFTETDLAALLGAGDWVYPASAYFPSSGTIALFISNIPSGTTRHKVVAFSTDGGTTWSTPEILVGADTNLRPYAHCCADTTNNRLHVFWTPAASNEIAANAGDIMHGYLNMTASPKTLHQSNGDSIGNLGTVRFNTATPVGTVVDDASDRGFYMRVLDCEVDGSGNPLVTYYEVEGIRSIKLRYARRTAGAFVKREIYGATQTAALESLAGGSLPRGAVLVGANTVIVSVRPANDSETVLLRITTADSGDTFSTETVLKPARDVLWPAVFKGVSPTDTCQIAFLHGYYKSEVYSGTVPRSQLDIGVWPQGGASCDYWLVAEIDTDGVTNNVMYVQAGGDVYTPTAPFSTAVTSVHGEIGGSLHNSDNTPLDSATKVTSLCRFRMRAVNAANKTLVYDGDSGVLSASYHILQRMSAAEVMLTHWSNGTNSATHTSTTTVVAGTKSAVASRWDTALTTAESAISVDGSAVHSANATIDPTTLNTNGSDGLRFAEANNSGTYLDGDCWSCIIWTAAKADDWLRAATIAMRGDQHTLGAVEASSQSTFAGAGAFGSAFPIFLEGV